MTMPGDETKVQVDETKMKELNILESELKSLKKNAKVYHQQPNSCIYFLSNKDKELAVVAGKKAELKKKITS